MSAIFSPFRKGTTMKLFGSLALGSLVILGTALSAAEPLKVGDDAPDFSLVGSDGKTYKLSEFKGKKAVVVAWFPRAFTGGCTKECTSFKNDGAKMRDYEVAYFTASNDPVTHNTFSAEQKLYGPLQVTTAISDFGQPTSSKSITAGFKLHW
jgi:peroxiredoxin Q/BCP